MARMKRGMLIASILMLASVVLSACNQPYSQAPAVTSTPVPQNNLFATAIGQPTNMSDVQAFATGSAIAQQGGATQAPLATATLGAGITPQAPTSTPQAIVPTATLAVANAPSLTPVPPVANSGSYILHEGEFIYCIARRFNVNPDEIMSVNGITDNQVIYAGMELKLPKSGNSFPGNRMLSNHPTTYTVPSSNENVYSVACTFGDVDPSAIAQANGISVNSALSAGQTLKIP